ncbi:unnamed protein product [Effrenium voratum]|uniref:Uncharacterized protein n=1 Tax=Effrenium voratum TaxID=2562239 RepID=A0AA36IVR7_9DINO|nr:unnamed protein product [Effrenium voratum]
MDESDESLCFDSDDFDEDNRPSDIVFGEAGDVMAEFEEDCSQSEEEREEQKAACVYRARGDSPETTTSDEESADAKAEAALALRSRGIIRTQDSALVQATAPGGPSADHTFSRRDHGITA